MENFILSNEQKAILAPIAEWEVSKIRNLLNCVEEFSGLFDSLMRLHTQEITVDQFEACPYGKEYWAIYTVYRNILETHQLSTDPRETNVGSIIEDLLIPCLKTKSYLKNL